MAAETRDPWNSNFFWPLKPVCSYFQVGYGDIYCETDLGRVFIVFYMMGALVMFANFTPEIAHLIGDRPR